MNEYSDNIITLVDNEEKEHKFEILDVIDLEDRTFYALMPFSEAEDVSDEAVYYVFEQVVDEDGEEVLIEVEDNDLLDKLSGIFQCRFEEANKDEDTEADS